MNNHVDRNKRLAREWYQLLGSAKYEEAKHYVSDDFVFYPVMSEKVEGVDTFLEVERAHMDSQPGFTFQIINMVGEDDWVAVHFIFDGWIPEGTDQYMGLTVTKKHSHHDVMTWLRFNDEGKICEKRAKYNMFFVLKQLGVPEVLNLEQRMHGPVHLQDV